MKPVLYAKIKEDETLEGADDVKEKKIKRILEYVWIGVVLLVGYYWLEEKSLWVLFLITFLLAGLGALFINFFFDSVMAWRKKKKASKS